VTATAKKQTVPLGLVPTSRLPLLLRRAYSDERNGEMDVVIHDSSASKSFPGRVLNIYGRNAEVAPALREQLVAKWPEKFLAAQP